LGVYVYGFGTNGMASGFLHMMKLLFKGAKIVICLHRGIKTIGCSKKSQQGYISLLPFS